MITGLQFKKFNQNNEAVELLELTSNTIIMCENYKMKDKIVALISELFDELNGGKISRTVFYDSDLSTFELFMQCRINSLTTTIYEVLNDIEDVLQTITISVEGSALLNATTRADIWFVDEREDNGFINEKIYPLTAFQECDVGETGFDRIEVYRKFLRAVYGCYTGECVVER